MLGTRGIGQAWSWFERVVALVFVEEYSRSMPLGVGDPLGLGRSGACLVSHGCDRWR